MASSNPFRKPPSQENRFPAADHTDTSSRSILASRPSNVDPLAARGHARKKSSKKVRVLSPPPRSPERLDTAPSRPPDPDADADADSAPQMQWPAAHQEPQSPANPFSGAVSSRAETSRAKTEARRSLNVDSFRRLLLTGAASPPRSPPLSSAASSEQDLDNAPAREALSPPQKKPVPPPPPSSRHGRSLKLSDPPTALILPEQDLVPSPSPVSRSSSSSSSSSSGTSDGDGAPDSVESMMAAIDMELGTPASAVPSSGNYKKPVPAPPPPRGHSRATRSVSIPHQDSDPPSRTSLDSDPQPASLVIRQVPPPPPRRPSLGPPHRPPSILDADHEQDQDQDQEQEQEQDHTTTSSESPITPSPTHPKPAAKPPPPPTRQPSMRRAESYNRQPSVDAKPRDSMLPPPPPPPSRYRGSSQSSLDGQSSLESHESANQGKSNDILADLDALRREVDALRGKMS